MMNTPQVRPAMGTSAAAEIGGAAAGALEIEQACAELRPLLGPEQEPVGHVRNGILRVIFTLNGSVYSAERAAMGGEQWKLKLAGKSAPLQTGTLQELFAARQKIKPAAVEHADLEEADVEGVRAPQSARAEGCETPKIRQASPALEETDTAITVRGHLALEVRGREGQPLSIPQAANLPLGQAWVTADWCRLEPHGENALIMVMGPHCPPCVGAKLVRKFDASRFYGHEHLGGGYYSFITSNVEGVALLRALREVFREIAAG